MRRLRFSPRSSFARTLLLIVTLLFASLVTTYLVVLNFAILPSLQQFNKVLAYEVRMLMTDKLQLEDGTQLVVPPAFRREIYRELGISLYSDEAAEDAGLRWAQHYEFLSQQMAQQLGGPTEVRVEVNSSIRIGCHRAHLRALQKSAAAAGEGAPCSAGRPSRGVLGQALRLIGTTLAPARSTSR